MEEVEKEEEEGGGGDEWLFSDKMTGDGGAAKDQSDCVENNVACPSQMIYISQPYIRLSFFVIRTFQGISQRPGTKHKKAIFMQNIKSTSLLTDTQDVFGDY